MSLGQHDIAEYATSVLLEVDRVWEHYSDYDPHNSSEVPRPPLRAFSPGWVCRTPAVGVVAASLRRELEGNVVARRSLSCRPEAYMDSVLRDARTALGCMREALVWAGPRRPEHIESVLAWIRSSLRALGTASGDCLSRVAHEREGPSGGVARTLTKRLEDREFRILGWWPGHDGQSRTDLSCVEFPDGVKYHGLVGHLAERHIESAVSRIDACEMSGQWMRAAGLVDSIRGQLTAARSHIITYCVFPEHAR